jgi:hypothetical protein
MPTQHQQVLSVGQRSDGAVIYSGRQFQTRTVLVGNVFTATGLIEVGPNFGTGPAVVQALTGFRPKAIMVVAVSKNSLYTSTSSFHGYCNSMGITVDDNGTLVRYCRAVSWSVAGSYGTGDENGRVFSGPFSYRIYRASSIVPKRFAPVDGNITAVNDSGFSIEVNNDYSYKIAFLAFGGDVTIAHGKFPIDTATPTSASFPFSPDALIIIDMPRWNNELIYYQQTSGSSSTFDPYSPISRLFYGTYQGRNHFYFYPGRYMAANYVEGSYHFYLPDRKWFVQGRFTVSGNTLTVGNWSSSPHRCTSEAVYLALSGLSLSIIAHGVGAPANQTRDGSILLDFVPGTMIMDGASLRIAFDPHEQSSTWVCADLWEAEMDNNKTMDLGLYLFLSKRLAGSGRYFYYRIRNTSSTNLTRTLYIMQFASARSATQRELTLFVSSWYRQYLGIRKRWAKLLSAVNNFLVSLFYQSNRRTQMQMELEVSSGHESSLFQALTKLLYVRGFSIAEILDTTWGRNLRPIRLLTPSDIDVCRGDQLVLRLKTRNANQDRDMRAMNDIVRMALLDYRTGNPVYWLGLGSGIEYDEEGQAVITIPWNVLNQALGRERICRYRVELWPDERLGAAGWIVHVGTIREVR